MLIHINTHMPRGISSGGVIAATVDSGLVIYQKPQLEEKIFKYLENPIVYCIFYGLACFQHLLRIFYVKKKLTNYQDIKAVIIAFNIHVHPGNNSPCRVFRRVTNAEITPPQKKK